MPGKLPAYSIVIAILLTPSISRGFQTTWCGINRAKLLRSVLYGLDQLVDFVAWYGPSRTLRINNAKIKFQQLTQSHKYSRNLTYEQSNKLIEAASQLLQAYGIAHTVRSYANNPKANFLQIYSFGDHALNKMAESSRKNLGLRTFIYDPHALSEVNGAAAYRDDGIIFVSDRTIAEAKAGFDLLHELIHAYSNYMKDKGVISPVQTKLMSDKIESFDELITYPHTVAMNGRNFRRALEQNSHDTDSIRELIGNLVNGSHIVDQLRGRLLELSKFNGPFVQKVTLNRDGKIEIVSVEFTCDGLEVNVPILSRPAGPKPYAPLSQSTMKNHVDKSLQELTKLGAEQAAHFKKAQELLFPSNLLGQLKKIPKQQREELFQTMMQALKNEPEILEELFKLTDAARLSTLGLFKE